MTYDHELILIEQIYAEDEIGNQIAINSETTVLCRLKSVARNEFYNAAVVDMKPEAVFIVHGYEYNNEKRVRFDGTEYTVIRTYAVDFEEIELVCEKVIGACDSKRLVDHKLVQDLKMLVETILDDPDVTMKTEDKAAYQTELDSVFEGW